MSLSERLTERVTLHFDLSHLSHLPAEQDFTIRGHGHGLKLRRHTDDTRRQHAEKNLALAAMAPAHLARVSHFCEDVEIKSDVVSVHWLGYPSRDPNAVADDIALIYHVVPDAHLRRSVKAMRHHHGAATPAVLAHFGIAAAVGHAHDDEMLVHAARLMTPQDTAISIVMQHPEISSFDPSLSDQIRDIVAKSRNLQTLWSYISTHMPDNGSDPWYVQSVVRDADGNVMSPADGLVNDKGEAIAWPTQVIDGKTVTVIPHHQIAPGIDAAARPVVQEVLRKLKQQPALKGRNWSTQHGVTVVDRMHTPAPRAVQMAALRAQADAAADWTIKTITSQYGLEVDDGSISFVSGRLSFNVTNRANRWLGVYYQMFDASGKVVSAFPDGPSGFDGPYYIRMIGSGDTMFGAWLPTDSTEIAFDVPDKVTSINVLLGGLGHGHEDGALDLNGIVCTAFISYAIPALLLMLSVGLGGKKWWLDFFGNEKNIKALVALGLVATAIGMKTINVTSTLVKAGETAAGVLLGAALKEFALKFCQNTTMQQLVEQAPLVGVALRIAACSASVLDMERTTIDVAKAPATYTLEVKRSMALHVTLKPDPTHGRSGENPIWPKVADHWIITVQYRGGTTLRRAGPMPGADDGLIETTFSKLTGDELPSAPGEQFQIIAAVYSNTNWMAGQWISGWIEAVPTDGDSRSEGGSIVEQLVPLIASTSYYQREKLAYDGASKDYVWQNIIFSLPGALADGLVPGPAPAALITAFATKSVRLASTASVAGGADNQWTVHDPAVAVDYDMRKVAISDDTGKVVDYELEVHNATHPSPTGTQEDLPRQNVSRLAGITVNDLAYRVGYCYYADNQNLPLDYGTTPVSTGMYLFETLSSLARPSAGLKAPTRGFALQPCVAFDQFGPAGLFDLSPALSYMAELDDCTSAAPVPADIVKIFVAQHRPLPDGATVVVVTASAAWRIVSAGGTQLFDLRRQVDLIKVFNAPAPEFSGNNFYLDTRTFLTAGTRHLRRIDLGTGSAATFDYDTRKSFGAFTMANIDAMAIHPSGYAVGVSYDNHQMSIVKLSDAAVDEADAPPALPFSGEGLREGLMRGPVAMTIAADGRILVLEQDNARIQAFDTSGNPVQCFAAELSFSLDASLMADLDKANASPALISALQASVPVNPTSEGTRNLLAPLLSLPDTVRAALDAGSITGEMLDAFRQAGVPLSDAAKVGKTSDGLWLMSDGGTYDLRYDGEGLGDVDVYRGISLDIEVKGAGAEWLLRDRTNTLTFDVKTPTAGATGLQARQLVSVMGLKDPVSTAVTYLDVAMETKGFIYVLSYLKPASGPLSPSDYRLDLYNPDGTPVTPDPALHNGEVNAARMTVDQWRTVFTLNYEQMEGPAGRPEPTISQWIPTTP